MRPIRKSDTKSFVCRIVLRLKLITRLSQINRIITSDITYPGYIMNWFVCYEELRMMHAGVSTNLEMLFALSFLSLSRVCSLDTRARSL